MKIGIDIDGTITTPFYWLEFFNRKLDKEKKPSEINTYDHHLAFNMSLKSFNEFRKKYLYEIHDLAIPRYEASEYINRLFFMYQAIHIVTARENCLRPLTETWLNKYKINYNSLHHLGGTEKLPTALKLRLDVFLEDRLETAMTMIKWQIPTILFNTPYNQGFDHALIYRVNTWQEAFEVISMLEKKKSQKQLKLLT